MDIKIYCDGSCLGNGKSKNFGGYAVVVVANNQYHTHVKRGFKNTTNNRMELGGLLVATKMAKRLNQEVNIYCDSAYCVNTVNDWMHRWAASGWIKKSDKKPPENLDIIKQLYELLNFEPKIHIIKTKGHDIDKFNNMADKFAVEAAEEEQLKYLQSLKKAL